MVPAGTQKDNGSYLALSRRRSRYSNGPAIEYIGMKTTIRSSQLQVGVKHHGAELCSILDSRGTEYLWQGDPDIWAGQAPILFPIVGKLKDNSYRYQGRVYSLQGHGFANKSDFKLVDQSADALCFQLAPSDTTRNMYPFEFVLNITYILSGTTLAVTYRVTNNGDDVMPFSIGAHPGFACSWGDNDRPEDYYLEFAEPETVQRHVLDKNHLLSDTTEPGLNNSNILRITKNIFNNDALIFLDLKSERVTLCSDKHSRQLTMEFPGFPHLGIWAKPAAPYVCIEPWYGHDDPAGADGNIMNKPGIIKLEAGDTFSCRHHITVHT
jgi:galactose mutarotase-like enzyme